MVKARAIRKAEVDEREAAQAAEREQDQALTTLRSHVKTLAKLQLAVTEVLWSKLSAAERAQIRGALSVEEEQAIKAAIARLD